jgi:preprotein translocase subunit YajC
METTSAALFISISLVIFGISYYYFTTRHKERMEILERALPPDYFIGQSDFSPLLLVLGIISIGISLGIVCGTLFSDLFPTHQVHLMIISIFLGLGIALIISYFIIRKKQKKD